MSTTDKILELLDNALQSSPEMDVDRDSMGQYLEEDQCWRCMRNATPEGTTCAGCLAYMEGKSDEDPRAASWAGPTPWSNGNSNPMADVRATLQRFSLGSIVDMRTMQDRPPALLSGPGIEVSTDRIVYGGHVITDPEILREAITVRHEADGWMWVRWNLGRALELAVASMRDSMAVVIERWRIAADTLFPVVAVPRLRVRFERPRFRYTADPEQHPEHLEPLVRAVMGRGPVEDPVLHSDDWSGWMGTVPPWTPPTALELMADEIRAAAEDVVGPPSTAVAELLDRCPTHGVELHGGLCRRCHR